METCRPRVVSEVRKTFPSSRSAVAVALPVIARMTGTLLWKTGLSEWHLVQAEIRQGRLVLWSQPKVYFPLQRLNLEAVAEFSRTFTLTRHTGQLLATFQTLTDNEYEAWVKALAVDILRQTPLHEVRFLDIIGITRKESSHSKSEIPQWLSKTPEPLPDYDVKNLKIRRAQKLRPKLSLTAWSRTQSLENIQKTCVCVKDVSDESGIGSGDENQSNQAFVSVRDKKQFFESLTNTPSITRSLSIAEIKPVSKPEKKQLLFADEKEKLPSSQQVQRMRQLFERSKGDSVTLRRSVSMINTDSSDGAVLYANILVNDNDDEGIEEGEDSSVRLLNQRRLQRGERKLSKLRIQMIEVEDTIKVIADRILTIRPTSFKRREGIELFTTLKRRLEEENSRLERLQEETAKVLNENKKLIRYLNKTQKL